MSNSTATFGFTLTSSGISDESDTLSTPYQARNVGIVDVPDAATSATEYAIPFGSIASATGLRFRNLTGQDLHIRINGAPGSVSGTLVSGTKTMALASVTGEHLSVELVASHGTPGDDLAVRRSSGNVIVTSYNSSGVQASDVSDVKVWQGGSPNLFRLPNGGFVQIAMGAAPGATPIASASVLLSTTQSGAGTVKYWVFGDPV